jgi:hypothetical protein
MMFVFIISLDNNEVIIIIIMVSLLKSNFLFNFTKLRYFMEVIKWNH